MIELIDVYATPEAADVLYRLLRERTPDQAISHRRLPSWLEHCAFVDSRPYQFWYLARVGGEIIGAIYLTQRLCEIGVHLFKKHESQELRRQVILALMYRHPRERYVANVNPKNAVLTECIESIGFEHIQNTYELRQT